VQLLMCKDSAQKFGTICWCRCVCVCGLNVVVSARTGVTEVYGDLSDIDDIDRCVDVCVCVV